MAANAIADDELRDKLQNLGESVGPITPSTRPLLLRKLKRLQKEDRAGAKSTKRDTRRKSGPSNQKSRSPSRKLVGFSSDEENLSDIKSKRRISNDRGIRVKVEDVDGANTSRADDSDKKPRERRPRTKNSGNSTVDSMNESSSLKPEFSDSDSATYTGPFHRGSFRFRSFRRKKDSSESSKSSRQTKQVKVEDELPRVTPNDTTDGINYPKRNLLSSCCKLSLALFAIAICVGVLCPLYLNGFRVGKYAITPSQGLLPFCKENVKVKCLPKEDVQEKYAYFLMDVLSLQAGQFDCGDEGITSRNISKDKLDEMLNKKILKDFPNWTLGRINDVKPGIMKMVAEQVELIKLFDKEGVLLNQNASVDSIKWYESLKPYKSLVCRIHQSFSKVVSGIAVASLVLLLLISIYYGVRNHWKKEEEDTLLMYKFVENIIDILRKHHDACKTDKELPPYLPIPHVRDMLIKPSERKSKANVWSRAVRFLSANESRIRVESQRIAGEDFEVWRWIHILSPKHHSHKVSVQDTKKPKCWQGQAFENFQWAVNPPVISPTPCLKIRNMFDPDMEQEERWHVVIQDAILEKCIDAGANIVHIAVDKSSSEGCVYVKCDSNDSAGVSFKSLHGSWFDGRLVAVKYLTLRRYHQRFPKALTATGSLKTSGSSPSSLVTLDPEDEDIDANDSETEV